jgi:Cu2+-exporting ATPase
MKRILFMMLCAAIAFPVAFAQQDARRETRETVTFFVKDMDCANCVKKVEKNIAFERGVTDLQCELPAKTVKVTYRTDRTSEDKLVAAFKKIGMEAERKAETTQPSEK